MAAARSRRRLSPPTGGLCFANEDGDVYVARAGRTYEEIAKIMSTPAISDGVMVVRTLGHVCGIGQK